MGLASASARRRLFAVAGAGVGLLTLIGYVVLISAEQNNSVASTLPWALLILMASTAALCAGWMTDVGVARTLLAIAAIVLGLLGLVAMFSIGIGLLAAALLAALARAQESNRHARPSTRDS